jgi:hypothetical protein
MGEVQKPSNSGCHIPSSEHFGFYLESKSTEAEAKNSERKRMATERKKEGIKNARSHT